jgi:hypothetical protein
MFPVSALNISAWICQSIAQEVLHPFRNTCHRLVNFETDGVLLS